MRLHILYLFIFITGCGSLAQEQDIKFAQEKPKRKLFTKSSVVLKSPTKYLMRETNEGEYDPKPRIVMVDEQTGRYELRWIGYDGQEKIVAYQKKDALNALVEARVNMTDSMYTYHYLVKNLPDSPTYVGSFIVQTYSGDIRDEHVPAGEHLHIGHMSRSNNRFSMGLWRTFAPVTEKYYIVPGTDREFQIVSKSRPGILGCAARAGAVATKGVGEHLPSELEAELPRFTDFASCLTIGPDERLDDLSIEGRSKYFLDNLQKFEEAGWMAGDTPKIYQAILEKHDLAGSLSQARKDLEQEYITSEVFHIIEGLNR